MHGAPTRARVSRYRYAPKEELVGRSGAALCYVLEGGCWLWEDSDKVHLSTGDEFEFLGGGYRLIVDPSVGVEIVWVYDLSSLGLS